MVRIRIAVMLLVVVLAGCGYFAKTNVGKAVQSAELEQKLVVKAASAVKSMCVAQPPTLDKVACDKAQELYGKWRSGQIVAAQAIAKWKAVSNAGGTSAALMAADENVQAELDRLQPLINAVLDFAKQFVNLEGLRKQITEGQPVSSLPVPWPYLEGAAVAAR